MSPKAKASGNIKTAIQRVMVTSKMHSKYTLRLDLKRGALYRFVGRVTTTFLEAGPSDFPYKPAFGGGVITARNRLNPIQSTARHILAVFYVALHTEVDHRAAEEITLTAEGCNGLPIVQDIPPWSLRTRVVCAAPVVRINQSVVVSVLLAVRCRFDALGIEARFSIAGAV